MTLYEGAQIAICATYHAWPFVAGLNPADLWTVADRVVVRFRCLSGGAASVGAATLGRAVASAFGSVAIANCKLAIAKSFSSNVTMSFSNWFSSIWFSSNVTTTTTSLVQQQLFQ